MVKRDLSTIDATLTVRRWLAKQAAATGQPVTPDDLLAYVAKRYPDLKGEALGYVITYAPPVTREWPGGPT